MPVTGRKPKPEGQKRNRHAPTYEWVDVPDVPFTGGPKLPARWLDGRAWPARTKRWWAVLSSMPHCVLWSAMDWEEALDTAYLHAQFASGATRVATELRNRGKVLGTTVDARRDLRIRYVDPNQQATEPAGVTRMDDYRTSLG